MAYYSGFQSNMAQRNAFQIKSGGTEPVKVGGGGIPSKINPNAYQVGKWEFELSERNRVQAEKDKALLSKRIEAEETKLAKLEAKRLQNLDNERMQLQVLALMKEIHELDLQALALQERINFLRREEEDIFVLLHCLPFVQ